jgi:hypothetical protein
LTPYWTPRPTASSLPVKGAMHPIFAVFVPPPPVAAEEEDEDELEGAAAAPLLLGAALLLAADPDELRLPQAARNAAVTAADRPPSAARRVVFKLRTSWSGIRTDRRVLNSPVGPGRRTAPLPSSPAHSNGPAIPQAGDRRSVTLP